MHVFVPRYTDSGNYQQYAVLATSRDEAETIWRVYCKANGLEASDVDFIELPDKPGVVALDWYGRETAFHPS